MLRNRKAQEDIVVCTKGGHFNLDTPEISRVTLEQLAECAEAFMDK